MIEPSEETVHCTEEKVTVISIITIRVDVIL